MPESENRLAERIQQIAAEAGGLVAVAARDLKQGRSLDRHAKERFPAASVIKICILVELLARVEDGDLRQEDRLVVKPEEKMPGSGVLTMLHDGLELTLEDLAHLMIVISDNTASNMLIDHLGCNRINARMQSLGMRGSALQRKFFDMAARDRGQDNWVAAGDLADLLAGLERGEVVSATVGERALAIMRKQQFDGRIPRLLPSGTKVANKTGTISGVSHDAGVIYAPTGPLALAVLTKDCVSPAAAETAIRQVALAVYEEWGVG